MGHPKLKHCSCEMSHRALLTFRVQSQFWRRDILSMFSVLNYAVTATLTVPYIFFSKNKIITKRSCLLCLKFFPLNIPPTRQKFFQNFTSSCIASIKNYESSTPDLSIPLHFLQKKEKTDDILVYLLLGGVERIYVVYILSPLYLCQLEFYNLIQFQ